MKLLMYPPLEANAWKMHFGSSLEAVSPMVGKSPEKLQANSFGINQVVLNRRFGFTVAHVCTSIDA